MARGGLTTIANRGLPSMMPGEHSGNELAAAADTELVECRSQVFLNGVGRYMQFPDDLAGGVSPDDQGDDTGLRGGQTMGVQGQHSCDHAGQPASGLAGGVVRLGGSVVSISVT
jgi:hypothetical protein